MDAFPQPGAPGGFGAFGPGGEIPKRAHLYIGNLSPRVTEYMLQEIFAVAGPVQGVKIIPDRNFQHGGLNYGFVEYHDLRSAETALQSLNGRKIFDCEIRCNWAYQNQTAKEDLTNHCHIFVGDLSPEVTDEILNKAFMAFGTLSDARVMWDMNSGKSRGYGFLAFRDKTDAEQAIATMNGEWLGTRAIRVNWANQKNGGMEGGAPGGGGGGASSTPSYSSGAPQAQAPQQQQQQQQYIQPMQQQMQPQQPAMSHQAPSPYDSSSVINSTIYVGNLVPFCTQADLIPLFQSFGHIIEIRMQADRGFAFIKLDSHENAQNAISQLSGVQVQGRGLKCSWGKDRMDVGAGGGGQQQYQPQQQQYSQQYAQQSQAPQDADAVAAAAAWQAQYGAQYAAYMQQQMQIQAQMQQQQQQQGRQ